MTIKMHHKEMHRLENFHNNEMRQELKIKEVHRQENFHNKGMLHLEMNLQEIKGIPMVQDEVNF
jgi:hypothetical protein